MKNVLICKNCNSENPFYGLICGNCKFYLRERIYNIDLWKIISQLIESPSFAFKNIIFSEHKNYLVLLLLLISGKLFLNGIFLLIFFNKWNASISDYFTSYFIFLIFTVSVILFFSGIFGFITKRFGIKTKFNDNFALLVYSFLPYTFGCLILFTIELVVFGETLFYYDPSPFVLKGTIAYTLLIFECLLVMWSLFLTITALKVQSQNIFYSTIFALFIHAVIYLSIYYLSSSVYL